MSVCVDLWRQVQRALGGEARAVAGIVSRCEGQPRAGETDVLRIKYR